jgi:hypothetical protein
MQLIFAAVILSASPTRRSSTGGGDMQSHQHTCGTSPLCLGPRHRNRCRRSHPEMRGNCGASGSRFAKLRVSTPGHDSGGNAWVIINELWYNIAPIAPPFALVGEEVAGIGSPDGGCY